jgi:anti-sigma factor RsiW
MDHTEARSLLLARRRGTLDAEASARLGEHLDECAACRQEDAADAELSVLLEQRLPRPSAPGSLKRALEEKWGNVAAPAPSAEPAVAAPPAALAPAPRPQRRAPFYAATFAAMAAGALLALGGAYGLRARAPDDAIVAEAVNDHLRVLYSEHPVEVESGGIHRVKPWFEGRVDFAPVVDFAGDDDYPLVGGSIGYFVDRKAATFVFRRRLHQITLFVFRAEGLKWPIAGGTQIGSVQASVQTQRGFHVILWREGDLGYALVSDVNENDLRELAGKIVSGK